VPGLTEPVALAGRWAPARVLFGPHPTNLGDGRTFSRRHVAYYQRRAAGGTGVLVTETASVHPSDWPYERAPLAAECGEGWSAIAAACRPEGTVVLAGIGHTGAQGSSAYSQSCLWAPSRVADAVSRELPYEMEQVEIDELVAGFAAAASVARDAGLDGVEVDMGATALLRQFHSGLTNHRTDAYGSDRLKLSRDVLTAVRAVLPPGAILAARLSCDELAPWAGVTPEQAAGHVAELAPLVDLVTIVRGGPYSASAYRPDTHGAPGANADLCRQMREAAAVATNGAGGVGGVAVVLQGSVVDPVEAQHHLDDGIADLVEMTRAQIADARLVALVRTGRGATVRPCILCNQTCMVRDARNPVVTCVGDPRSGHELEDPPVEDPELEDPELEDPTVESPDTVARDVVVVGGGPAGLEAARVAAIRGHRVRLVEQGTRVGGALRLAALGAGRSRLSQLVSWLEAECARLGVVVETQTSYTSEDVASALDSGAVVVMATGSRRRPHILDGTSRGGLVVVDVGDLLGRVPAGSDGADAGSEAIAAGLGVEGPVVVDDPVGGPIGISIAEALAAAGRDTSIVAPDPVAGTLLSRTGDLADANVRLQRAGVRRQLRARITGARAGASGSEDGMPRSEDGMPGSEDGSSDTDGHGAIVLEDVWTGTTRPVACRVVVDCGHRLPDDRLAAPFLDHPCALQAGDCVAPRTVYEAILEGRRAGLRIGALPGAAVPVGHPGARS